MLHVDADGLLTCPIWANIEEFMHVQTLPVPGANPQPLLYQGAVLGQRPTQITITPSLHLGLRCFMSILESTRHKLRIADGLTLVHPGLCGWEVFPMPRALTHTRIIWALSPTVPQVPGVTLGCPLCPWCFEHSSWRGTWQPKREWCTRTRQFMEELCTRVRYIASDWRSLHWS